jgi:hypothetical protein
MMIGIATEIETIRPSTPVFTMEMANMGVRFALAKSVFNFVVSRFYGESVSSPSSFLDAQYFSLRGSLFPIPAILSAQNLEVVSPVFKDFNVLLLSLLKPHIPTSSNPVVEGRKVWENIFKSIFVDWLGLNLMVPIGGKKNSPPISNPSTYLIDFIIDPTLYNQVRVPKIIMPPSTYAVSPVVFPTTYAFQLTQAQNPSRPFFGRSMNMVWDISSIMTIANSFFVELGVLNTKVSDPNIAMRNTWNLFETFLIQALNTGTIIPTTLPTQVYGNPSCVSSSVVITSKIWWA